MPGKKKPKDTTAKAPATAAGQALGYGLQYTRLTAMLLSAPADTLCSLEVLDDVAGVSPDGTTKLAQSKSALTDNPVADRSVSLWKTIYNWLELVKGGFVVPAKTIFELYVSRPVTGPLISAFHTASTVEQAHKALDQARDEIWGKAPDFPEKLKLSDGMAKYATTVLDADRALVVPIIAKLRLECGSGSPQTDIEAAIRQGPVSEARIPDVADKLCGWVKREVDKQLERGVPAVISQSDFHREYVSYVRRVDRDQILKSLAGKPSDAEKIERLPDPFVQQLELINLDYDEKLEAISDFLRACSDRSKWSQAGDVHEESFAELDDNLLRTWRNINKATTVTASNKAEVERGLILLAECMKHQTRVQGMEPPTHFVPGCFHRLADELTIGWHPSYKQLLGTAFAKAS